MIFSLGITFDCEETLDIIEPIVTSTAATKNLQAFDTNARNQNMTKRRKHNQNRHNNKNSLNQNNHWISKKHRKIFRSSMKLTCFFKKVDKFKASQKSFKVWRYMDGSSFKKMIMSIVSALLHCNVQGNNSHYNSLLLHFAASIHVSYDKNKFTTFIKATRSQELLCSTKVVLIEGWGEILLLLRIGNPTSILIFQNVAYFPIFALNLALLACLNDEIYR